jgi:hypothetical protein
VGRKTEDRKPTPKRPRPKPNRPKLKRLNKNLGRKKFRPKFILLIRGFTYKWTEYPNRPTLAASSPARYSACPLLGRQPKVNESLRQIFSRSRRWGYSSSQSPTLAILQFPDRQYNPIARWREGRGYHRPPPCLLPTPLAAFCSWRSPEIQVRAGRRWSCRC